METPNAILFRCPNCNNRMFSQYPGYSEQFKIETICECEIIKFNAPDKHEVCTNCNMVIVFKIETGFKKVKLLRPVVQVWR